MASVVSEAFSVTAKNEKKKEKWSCSYDDLIDLTNRESEWLLKAAVSLIDFWQYDTSGNNAIFLSWPDRVEHSADLYVDRIADNFIRIAESGKLVSLMPFQRGKIW